MDFTNIKLDKSSKTPLYLQLKEHMLKAIWDKDLTPGDLIPSEGTLSEMLGISKSTIRQCMTELSNEGYIEKKRNRGTIILDRKLNLGFSDGISSFTNRITQFGMLPMTKLLQLSVDDCPKKIANMLNIDESQKIIRLIRLRYADNMPVLYIDSYLSYEENRFILGHDFSKESLYDLLDQNSENKITRVERTVYASEASTDVAKAFNVKAGYPMLTVETNAFDKNDIIREYSISYSPGSRNQYKFTITR